MTAATLDPVIVKRTSLAAHVSLGGGVAVIIAAILSNLLPGWLQGTIDILALAALFVPMVVMALGIRQLVGDGGMAMTVAVIAAGLAPVLVVVVVAIILFANLGGGKPGDLRVLGDALIGLTAICAGLFVGLVTRTARAAGFASRSVWWVGAPAAICLVLGGIPIVFGLEAFIVLAAFGMLIYLMWTLALPRMLEATARGQGPGTLLPDDVRAPHPRWLGWTAYLSAASFLVFFGAFITLQAIAGQSQTVPVWVAIILGLAAVLVFGSMTAVGIGIQRVIEGDVPSMISLLGLAVGVCALLSTLVLLGVGASTGATNAPSGFGLSLALVAVGYGSWMILANAIAMRHGHLVGMLPWVGIGAGALWILAAVLGAFQSGATFVEWILGVIGYLVWAVWLGRNLTSSEAGARRPVEAPAAP